MKYGESLLVTSWDAQNLMNLVSDMDPSPAFSYLMRRTRISGQVRYGM